MSSKKKVIMSMIVGDTVTPSLLRGISGLLTLLNLQQTVLTLICSPVGTKEQHVRIPNFYEAWIDGYLDYDFYMHFRMVKSTFVPLDKCVLIGLWYLGKGDTIVSTADRFNVAQSKCWACVKAVVESLNCLARNFIVWPNRSECVILSEQLYEKRGFPDGTHFRCKISLAHHTSYQDRKFQHFITAQGICTSTRLFTNVSVGYLGSIHDARVLKESVVGQAMYSGGRFVL